MTKWKVYDNPNIKPTGSFIIEANDSGECLIANVETENADEWAMVQEDGYLMARAPELQETLRVLVDGITDILADDAAYQTMREQHELFQKVRMALGQARLVLEWSEGPAPWDTVIAPTHEALAVA